MLLLELSGGGKSYDVKMKDEGQVFQCSKKTEVPFWDSQQYFLTGVTRA